LHLCYKLVSLYVADASVFRSIHICDTKKTVFRLAAFAETTQGKLHNALIHQCYFFAPVMGNNAS